MPGDPSPSSPDLVGRQVQQSVLEGLLEAARQGRGGGALLVGEAGIGKSALLAWYLDRLPAETTVVRVEVDPDLPGLGLQELLREMGIDPEVGASQDDLRTATTDARTLAVAEEVVARVDEELARGPVVVAVEDLHWASPTLLVALRRLAPLADDRPLHLLATLRPGGSDPVLARTLELLDRAGTVTVAVGALDDDSVIALASVVVGARPIGRLRRLVERAGGNPLLIGQVLTDLGDALVLRPNGTADLTGEPVVGSVGTWVGNRIDQLTSESAQLCRVAAVLGATTEVSELVSLLRCSELDLLEPLEEAMAAGLLNERGHQVRFSHELVRDAVHDGLPDAVRRSLHRRVAETLRAGHAEPARVAYHLSFDLQPGDEDGLRLVTDAVSRLAVTDPAAALEMIARTSESGGPPVADRLAVWRAEALAWLGRIRAAVEVAERSVDGAVDRDERHRLRRLLAGLMILQGRSSEVVEVLVRTHDELDGGDPRRPYVAAEAALARFTAGDVPGSRELADEAARDGQTGGDVGAEVLGRLLLARLGAHDHHYRTGAADGWAAAERADDDTTGRAHRYVPWFFCALTCFDLDSSDTPAALAAGRDRSDRHATYWATPLYDGLAAAMAYREGRLDDCLAELTASYETALETGSVQSVVWCLAHRALIELDRGDEGATATLEAAESWWSTGRAMLGIDHFYLAGARQRLRAGDPEGAFDHLDEAWRLFQDLGLRNCQPLLAPDLARLSTALGHTDRAREVADEMARVAALDEAPAHAAVAAWCAALVDHAPDRIAAARTRFARLGRRTDELWAGLDLAVLLAQQDRRPEARTVRDEVMAVLDAQDLAALRRELVHALAPFNLGRAARRLRPKFGWGSLTPTERAIVELVATGRSNAEIAAERGVSTRTVESHLHRVYTKLGIDTRTQLAVQAAQQLGTGEDASEDADPA